LLCAGRRAGELGHGRFGEQAPVADLPFVVDLGEDGAGEAQERRRVGEDPGDAGAALDVLVGALEAVGAPDFLPVLGREAGRMR